MWVRVVVAKFKVGKSSCWVVGCGQLEGRFGVGFQDVV
jgi:hypothetical protein